MAAAKKQTKREIGFEAEKFALRHLENQGLDYLKSNYSCKLGEIDLIMHDPKEDHLVFIEVKFRSSKVYGGAISSISKSKQSKIIKTATKYLLDNGLYDKITCRFDVFAIDKDDTQEITWIKNAFGVNY